MSRVVTVRPGDDLQAIMDAAEPGTTLKLLPGTYRSPPVTPRPGQRLEGEGPR